MKQPVWILNSSLLVLFFISQLLLFMIQRVVPRRISINPSIMVIVQKKPTIDVDITKIYEHDLFGTYEEPIPLVPSMIEDVVAVMPRAPKIIIPEVPVEKVPTFFAPLDVVLKGVIFVKDDPASCIAIIQLKKTKEEHNYQVGNLIEDAQILKILSNRIIIIRSNGQQETLYLREEDAVSDFNTEVKSVSKSVVENSSDDKYTVNIDEFTHRIHNLGEFINLLDLTTVYKQGKSFGCRVGKIDNDSLGSLMGLKIDDIIVKIDDYYVDDLANRLQLYDHIIQKRVGDVIEVVLYRGQDVHVLMYGLVDNVSKSIVFTPQETYQKLMEELSKHEAKVQNTIEKAVVIQAVTQEQNPVDINIDIDELESNFNESNLGQDQNSTTLLHQIMNPPVKKQSDIIDSLNLQTSNELDMHQKKLAHEHANIMPTLQDMKTKDRNNMMRQSSRNVIFNGMQQ